MEIVNKLFPNNMINSPSSPDIAYPIETLWSELKKKIKDRAPKTKEDLKKFAIEEWNKIPLKNIKKRFNNWRKRCKKIIEIKGNRLYKIHLKEIIEKKKLKKIRKIRKIRKMKMKKRKMKIRKKIKKIKIKN